MPLTSFYPRGNALTEAMPLLASDGTCWLAYIEGVPSDPPSRLWRELVLPGRRLRFDSATESRVTTDFPAGSPFLADARLQSLLDEARPVPPAASTPRVRSRDSAVPRERATGWITRAAETLRALLADWSRQRRRGATQRQVMSRHV